MKIALAQINPVVGDLAGNVRRHVEMIGRARDAAADVVVFPELSVVGYPPKDLLNKSQFVEDQRQAVDEIARACRGIVAVAGFVERNPEKSGRALFNVAGILADGGVRSVHVKSLLPTYDVFDESRYFEPATAEMVRRNVVELAGKRIGITICEDLWNDKQRSGERALYARDPVTELKSLGAEVLINISASPFVVGKPEYRHKLFAARAQQAGAALVVVNQVGGNDELVFDGNSAVYDAHGQLIGQCRDFQEDLAVVDLTAAREVQPACSTGLESIYEALVLGLRDYVRKTGFKSAVLGLSGGIDSALVAALAADALGRERVTGVAMPSRYSSEHSIADARKLAGSLEIAFHVVPIEGMHRAFEAELGKVFTEPGAASANDPARGGVLGDDLTEQNIQARIRGVTLMAFSNRHNHLLLTTGNKSELATGYCTLYGDMCGGLAVISDVPKTVVWKLARWINEKYGREVIPRSSIDKAPSAELKPGQVDQDSLPPYEVLDGILERYIEREKGAAEIIADGFDPALVMRVIRMVDRSEYKRRQAPPGLKVTSRAFGFGRRMPIAQGYEQKIPAKR